MNNCNCKVSGVVTSPEYNAASTCEAPPTQLRTVVIPASKGGDGANEPFAPVLGSYRNTIVVYAKNKATYIYDAQGVYTNLTGTDWAPQIAEVATAAVNAQSTADQATSDLQAYEVEANGQLLTLTNSLAAQQTALAAETTNRTEADSALSDQLSGLSTQVQQLGTEVGSQQTTLNEAITNLQNSISSETSAREAADTALQTSVDANTTAIANLEATVGSEASGFTKELMLDLSSQAGSDTVTLVKTTGNLGTTETTETEIPLPIASATQAGVLSANDYAAFAAGASSAGEEFTTEEKTKLDGLANIKSIGTNLTLSSSGVLSASGGSSSSITGTVQGIGGTGIPLGNITRVEAFSIRLNFGAGTGKFRNQFTYQFSQSFTNTPVVLTTIYTTGIEGSQTTLDSIPTVVVSNVSTTEFSIYTGQKDGAPAVSQSESPYIIEVIAIGY